MYEYLEGQIAGRSPGRLALDVSGVGYDIAVPLGAHFPDGGRFRVWTHFVVREDAHVLCGFPDRESRDLFRLLITVRGVGPGMALAILSGLPRAPLLDAIATGDVPTLTRIKGVGKKTAEQILLDMREKAQALRAQLSDARDGAGRDTIFEDAVTALLSIGYSEKEARKSVASATKRGDRQNLEELVRAALAS